VAVFLSNWKKHPVIGKVLRIDNDMFEIHYFEGGYNKEWRPLFAKNKTAWTDCLPIGCIILAGFVLQDSKLSTQQKKFLKTRYNELLADKEDN